MRILLVLAHPLEDSFAASVAREARAALEANGHIVDLSGRVDIGVTVQVVRSLPPELDKLVTEQVKPPKQAETPPKKRASNTRSNRG